MGKGGFTMSFGWFLMMVLLLLNSATVEAASVGAYTPVEDLKDPRIQDAAAFALYELKHSKEKYSFDVDDTCKPQIIAASQQVVAGLNLLMIVMARNTDTKDCVGAFKVNIYYHLDDTMEVTEWGKELSCEDAKVLLQNGMVGVDDGE
eukprot:scaffold3955_cov160-Cylindrotheca_fusiformis.AAC.2